MIYSEATITVYHRNDPSIWYKDVYTRKLVEIDYSGNGGDDNGNWINQILGDPNTLYIIAIISVIVSVTVIDFLIIWRVRKRKEEKAYQEYLQMKRMGKNLLSTENDKTKNNKKISSQ